MRGSRCLRRFAICDPLIMDQGPGRRSQEEPGSRATNRNDRPNGGIPFFERFPSLKKGTRVQLVDTPPLRVGRSCGPNRWSLGIACPNLPNNEGFHFRQLCTKAVLESAVLRPPQQQRRRPRRSPSRSRWHK